MSTLQDLFNTVEKFAFKVRSTNAKGDVAWEMIKHFLPEDTQFCSGLSWKNNRLTIEDIPMTNLKQIYDYVHDFLEMNGGDEDINSDGKKPDKWEHKHFFLQLIRIPLKYQLNLRRLCQIAYNLGQLKAVYPDKIYTEKVKIYFNKNNLKDINSYVELSSCDDKNDYSNIISNIKKINNIEDIVLKGGNNYYYKYIKYKNKYLISKK
jgi:hypothetical protein